MTITYRSVWKSVLIDDVVVKTCVDLLEDILCRNYYIKEIKANEWRHSPQ